MVDKHILWSKIEAMHRHLARVKSKRGVDVQTFLQDLDRQESVLFNLQMAVQNCIDMAGHVVSEKGLGIAGNTNELFYLLEDQGLIPRELTEKMVQAVGFRNLIVHEYARVDLEVVYRVSHENIHDLERFASILGEMFS